MCAHRLVWERKNECPRCRILTEIKTARALQTLPVLGSEEQGRFFIFNGQSAAALLVHTYLQAVEQHLFQHGTYMKRTSGVCLT